MQRVRSFGPSLGGKDKIKLRPVFRHAVENCHIYCKEMWRSEYLNVVDRPANLRMPKVYIFGSALLLTAIFIHIWENHYWIYTMYFWNTMYIKNALDTWWNVICFREFLTRISTKSTLRKENSVQHFSDMWKDCIECSWQLILQIFCCEC